MGNCPKICYCSKLIDGNTIRDVLVEIENNSTELSDKYKHQPFYSKLIYLQIKIKKYLSKLKSKNNKSSSSKTKPLSDIKNNKSNKKNNHNSHTTSKFSKFKNSGSKKDISSNKKQHNNLSKNILIEEQKNEIPNFKINKALKILEEDPFTKSNQQNSLNSLDPRIGPFDGTRKKYGIINIDEFSYEGEWKNGKRDGLGTLIWKNFAKYVGEFIEDKVIGFGKLTHNENDEYIGYWDDFQTHGIGKYNAKNFLFYEGYWEHDKQHKFGIETWKNKAKYIGEYYIGNKDGYGILDIKDKGIYEGQMRDGNINGVGIFIFKDNRKYEGEFVNNKMQGYGILKWPDGKIFLGEFRDDLQDGFGVFYGTKKIFIGIWENGLLQGESIIIENGKIKKYMFDKGKPTEILSDNYETPFEKNLDKIAQEKYLFI